MAERLLVSVAHPDDESFGTGSVIARATSCGTPTVVCCATRGEAGTVEDGVSPTQVAERREAELRSAASILGVERVEVLGLRDSGMAGAPGPETLAGADRELVIDRLREVVEEVRPTVVVTLDASDGHRDHTVIRDATLAAVDRARWRAQRVYLSCLPRSLMGRWVEHVRAQQPDSEHLELAAVASLGTPEEEITTVVDTSAHYELRWQAIRAHASQSSPYDVMPPDLQRAFLATDRLRRVRPAWTGEQRERDFL